MKTNKYWHVENLEPILSTHLIIILYLYLFWNVNRWSIVCYYVDCFATRHDRRHWLHDSTYYFNLHSLYVYTHFPQFSEWGVFWISKNTGSCPSLLNSGSMTTVMESIFFNYKISISYYWWILSSNHVILINRRNYFSPRMSLTDSFGL